jgi:hypothetical protein
MSWVIRNTILKPGPPCSDFDQGKYTYYQLDDMITKQGYIPVASESELVAMKTAGTKTMGAGTCWEDSYTLEANNNLQKFIQVRNIDFTLGGAWTTPIVITTGVYDGNELSINNFNGSQGLLKTNNTGIYCHNVRMNFNVNTTGRFIGVVDEVRQGVVDNVQTSGTVITDGDASAVMSFSSFELLDYIIICRCTSSADITTTGDGAGIVHKYFNRVAPIDPAIITGCEYSGTLTCLNGGGIVYAGRGDIKILKSKCTGNINASSVYVAGIMGYVRDGVISIEDCEVSDCTISSSVTSVSSDQGYAALLGYKYANTLNIERCKIKNVTVSVPNGRYVGTVNGRARTSTDTTLYKDIQVENCSVVCSTIGGGMVSILNDSESIVNSYASCSVTGGSVGGLMQNATAGSTVTDSYWDTTVGPATSPKGVASTTVDLQTPTGATGIYLNWDDLIWDFGDLTDLPEVLIPTPDSVHFTVKEGDIIIEMGQSNMEGRFGDTPLHTTENGYYWDQENTIPLLNDRGGATGGSHATYFAERYFQLRGVKPIMVEAATGGAGLTSTSSSNHYGLTGNMRDLASEQGFAAVFRVPNRTKPTAGLWSQGEQDAAQMDINPAYTRPIVKAAMQSVIDWWKETFPSVPFLIFQTGRPDSGDTTGYSDMRAIQQEIVNENTLVYMVSTNAVNFPAEGKMGDDVHYNYLGYQEMGEAFATFLDSIL